MRIKKIIPLLIIFHFFLFGESHAQLISVNQHFKEDFEISKYRNDNCIANMLNTIALNAFEHISNVKFTLYYEIEISDSLYFIYQNPIGNVSYSGNDISNYLLPEKVILKCGNLNETITIDRNINRYSFKKPNNPDIAKCQLIYSDKILSEFNNKIHTIRTCIALDIVIDTLISELNSFSMNEKYFGVDAMMFLTFINSQIAYIKSNTDSISILSNGLDTKSLYNKIKIAEARRNSVILSSQDVNMGYSKINNLLAAELAGKFYEYYDKWLHLSNLSKHLYSGEIAYMSSFTRTKPDIENFLNRLPQSAQLAFLNYIYSKSFGDARKAYHESNVNISLILISNYEYLSNGKQNAYSERFHTLKINCLETMRDSYIKLAELFDKNGNNSISINYHNQAKNIDNMISVVKNNPLSKEILIAENIAGENTFFESDEIVIDNDANNELEIEYITLPSGAVIQKSKLKTSQEDIVTQEEIDNMPEKVVDKKETKKSKATTAIQTSDTNFDCEEYNRKLNVLSDKIDSYSMFTIENLFNKYAVEHPECAKPSLNEWIKSIGRSDLLSKKRKQK